MFFDEKKLSVESINELSKCKISTVTPYALMLAPIYVFMRLNEKLVSVKAPLDFFTPEELNHLSRYEVFYIPKVVEMGARFQTAAKLISNLISPISKNWNGRKDYLSPSIHEISNESLVMMMPLWGRDKLLDPFYTAIFADELCGPFNPEKMVRAREITVARHESGILLSGLCIFILIHLGRFDLNELSEIRNTIYEAVVDRDEDWNEPVKDWHLIARDLKKILEQNEVFSSDLLEGLSTEWVLKLSGRLDRIRKAPKISNYPSLIYPSRKEAEV